MVINLKIDDELELQKQNKKKYRKHVKTMRSEFDRWYDETYPDTVGKYDALHVACRSAAALGWDAARKQTLKNILVYLEKEWEMLIKCL